jgi:hypothetical protein
MSAGLSSSNPPLVHVLSLRLTPSLNAFSSHFILVFILGRSNITALFHSANEMMYTSMHAFEANALTAPIPIFFPTVGGCLYSGESVVRKVAVIDPQICQFTFEVGQIVEKLSETDFTINYFATGKTTLRTCLLLPESILMYTAIKTNMYQKCQTRDFRSLAYAVHAEKKDTLLVDPEGIINTYTITYQYLVG